MNGQTGGSSASHRIPSASAGVAMIGGVGPVVGVTSNGTVSAGALLSSMSNMSAIGIGGLNLSLVGSNGILGNHSMTPSSHHLSSASGTTTTTTTNSTNGHHSGVVHESELIEIPQDVVPSLAHIPLKSYMIKDFPFNINCKGCNKAFPCYYTPKGFKKIPAPAYYVHCIDDCPEYRAKGQIKECEVCSFKFLDKQSLGIHKNSCRATNKRAMLAKKPKWMPYSILLTIINYSKFDGKIDCRGCKRKFPCYRNGTKVVPSLEYYVHCIEECKEYREKGWIQKCSQCKCKFLNTISLIQHMKGCFK